MQLLSKWALSGFSGGSSTPAGEKTDTYMYKLCDPLVHTRHFSNYTAAFSGEWVSVVVRIGFSYIYVSRWLVYHLTVAQLVAASFRAIYWHRDTYVWPNGLLLWCLFSHAQQSRYTEQGRLVSLCYIPPVLPPYSHAHILYCTYVHTCVRTYSIVYVYVCIYICTYVNTGKSAKLGYMDTLLTWNG